MSIYINTETNEYPVYESDVRREFNNTSFPTPFVAPSKFAAVRLVQQPVHDLYSTTTEGAPLLVEGEWIQNWIQTPATPEEITMRTDTFWSSVRKKRAQLLRDSDWMVSVIDCPLSDSQKMAWVAYRQQLRDITKQEFGSVSWPTPPKA